MIAISVATSAFADEDQFYDPVPKYLWGGDATKPFDTADAACRAGVIDLARNGKFTFASVKPGPSEDVLTCVFRDQRDNSPFERDIKMLRLCKDGAEASEQHDGRGMCRCKPGECKQTQTPPPQPQQPQSRTKAQRTALAQKICSQKPDPNRAPVTVTEAKATSKQLEEMLVGKADGRRTLKDYNAARKIVDANRGGFAEFDPQDFYDKAPSDVNIGQLCGNRDKDFQAANAVAGLKCTPKGYTWHHHEDLGRMQLVKTSAHAPPKGKPDPADARGHFGGTAIWNEAFCVKGKKADPTVCGYADEARPKDPKCDNP